MGLVQVTGAIGLELRIQTVQKWLYNQLIDAWGLTSATYNAYGMCYKNRRENGYIPEVFVSGNDYKEVGLNDKVYVQSFWGISDSTSYSGLTATTDVHVIHFVNLSKLSGISSLSHRGALEARTEVFKKLKKAHSGFEYTGEILGVDNVLSEYGGLVTTDFYAKADMHPWHIFRHNLTCDYKPDELSNNNVNN